ncbi:ATP-dependent RecD-like DNA helicase [bacterium]|nr:ATP-dependent RecD-like DNA helicase [bacterium]
MFGIPNECQSLEGEVERIVYQSDEDSYTVARFRAKDKYGEITITGNLAGVQPGEILNVKGRWMSHKKFGPQFHVESFTCLVPSSVRGIEKYLSSGMIKGIGPVMAKRLVGAFGKDTLDIIESKPEKLGEVEGIGPKRIGMITKAWETQKEIKQIMVFLQGHDVSAALAVKIYKHYGQEAISIVRENPYRLSTDIFGIGFKTADKIAMKLGMPADSLVRAKAGALFVLNQMADKGHCFLPMPVLIEECQNTLGLNNELVNEAINDLAIEQRIQIEEALYKDSKNQSIKCAYLAAFFTAEAGICRLINRLKTYKKRIRAVDSGRALDWVEGKMGITLDPIQKEAVAKALEKKIMIITGGPGTGKTTIIKSILSIYNELKIRIILAAPTGRAAKRMQEATGHKAKTIHRLLEFSPQKGRFLKDEQNPIEADLIILDEVSMVDTILMYHLLKAIHPYASMILVGDSNQLPSVGAGNVLGDICSSNIIDMVKLEKIFRQAQESLIVSNAHRILKKEFPVIPKKGEKGDFFFITEEDPEKILNMIIELYKLHIPNRFGFDPYQDIQVITPMNKGVVGAANLNQELQKHLNPVSPGIQRGGRIFKLHDKVMQIRNNYDKDVFNGDIGNVIHLDEDMLELAVKYDDHTVNYDIADLDELVLAYAISVHKSQGSEYQAIIMPVSMQHYPLLQRNLIYTALTRARRLIIMVGTKKALSIAIQNTKVEKRFTLLRERLMNLNNNCRIIDDNQ